MLDDGQVVDAANVVWCTGFRQVFDWIKLPIFDGRGWPVEYRGVVEGAPGLYFCGLSFQYAFSSMILPGVGRDAEYVADAIVRQLRPEPVEGPSTGSGAWDKLGALPRSADYRRSRRFRMGVMDDLARARDAFERREWAASYEALSRREPSTLSAEDFARLATAALLVGRRNDCVQALQRAYQLSRDTGHLANAARCAFWLAMVLVEIGEDAVSSGWIARAERVLDETTGDTVEHGYVAFYHLHRAVHAGRHDEASRRAEEVMAYGAPLCRTGSHRAGHLGPGHAGRSSPAGSGTAARCWTRR